MNRKEFLDELGRRLSGMDPVQVAEILEDFSGHFEAAGRQGKSDRDVCESLGDPADIAAQFMEDRDGDYAGVVPARRENGDGMNRADSDRSNGRTDYTDMHYEFDAGTISRIRTDLHACNLQIRSAKVQKVLCDVRGVSSSRFFVGEREGALTVEEEPPARKWLSWILGRKNKADVIITLPSPNERVAVDSLVRFGEVTVSNTSFSEAFFKMSAGNFNSDGCDYGEFRLESSAGNADVKGCRGDSFHIKCSAGNVTVEESKGELNARSSAGNVKALQHTGRLSCSSSAGNVTISSLDGDITGHSQAGNVSVKTVRGSVEAKSTAGNVKITGEQVYGMKAESSAGTTEASADSFEGDVRISSGAGDVKLTARRITGNIEAHSGIGSVRIILPADADYNIRAKSGMGKVNSEIKSNANSARTLSADSSMGNVSIKASRD